MDHGLQRMKISAPSIRAAELVHIPSRESLIFSLFLQATAGWRCALELLSLYPLLEPHALTPLARVCAPFPDSIFTTQKVLLLPLATVLYSIMIIVATHPQPTNHGTQSFPAPSVSVRAVELPIPDSNQPFGSLPYS